MNLKESAKLIETYLDLDRHPVGVKFLRNEEEYKAVDIPEKPNKVTYCNSIHLASKGHCLKLRAEHMACGNGAFALGFKEVPAPIVNGQGRVKKGIYENVEVSKSVNADMKFLETGEIFGYVAQPLSEYAEDDTVDIVIVVSGSFNIMRLIQGHGYTNAYTNNLRTIGLQAVCQDLTTYPFKTGDINISFLCPGTRLVANWQQHELGIGIPFAKWYEIVEGVIGTTNAFARDDVKQDIIKRMKENGYEDRVDSIVIGTNYDTGTYVGGKVEEL